MSEILDTITHAEYGIDMLDRIDHLIGISDHIILRSKGYDAGKIVGSEIADYLEGEIMIATDPEIPAHHVSLDAHLAYEGNEVVFYR